MTASRQYKQYTNDEKMYLKENYGKVPIKKIANKLKRKESAIESMARRMDLGSKGGAGSKYSKYEDECIKSLWGTKTCEEIGKKLGRSACAIRFRALELGMGPIREWYTTSEVAEMFNWKGKDKVNYLIKKGILEAEVGPTKRKIYSISDVHLKRFMKNHQNRYNTQRMNFEIEFLFERYPTWLTEKIESDKRGDSYIIDKREFTNDEDIILQEMYLSGSTAKEIAAKLDRTLSSVQSRLYQICCIKHEKLSMAKARG